MIARVTRRHERGMVLVLVLWMIASMALLVSAFNASVGGAMRLIGNELAAGRTQAILDAGVEVAAFNLLYEKRDKRWRADGRAYRQTIAGLPVTIRIVDEGGRIDLNKAPLGLIKRFLQLRLPSDRQVASVMTGIIETRALIAATGPEGIASQAARPAPLNRTTETAAGFQHVSQLLHIAEVSIETYWRIAPYLTVYNHSGHINPSVASRDILLSLPGARVHDAERLIASRHSGRDLKDALAEFSRGTGMVSVGEAGPAFTIEVAFGNDADSNAATTTVTILAGSKKSAPFHVMSWQSTVR